MRLARSPARVSFCLVALLVTLRARADSPGARTAPTKEVGQASASSGIVTLRGKPTDRVYIRSGSFTMGSDVVELGIVLALCQVDPLGEACIPDVFEDELEPHRVLLSDYVIARRETTVAEYRRCVETGPCATPPLAAGGKRFDVPTFPVTMVTWNDAATYCAWAGGRLPTEAEWERAARGQEGRRFPWGNVYNPFLLNGGRFSIESFDDRDGYSELAPVGSFPGGRTPDGIDDLAGNVEEWVSDYYAREYPEAHQENPVGPDAGDEKVVRGGSFGHGRAWQRGASRGHDLGSARRYWRGFRCVWSPKGQALLNRAAP